jgi:hypothetical protein
MPGRGGKFLGVRESFFKVKAFFAKSLDFFDEEIFEAFRSRTLVLKKEQEVLGFGFAVIEEIVEKRRLLECEVRVSIENLRQIGRLAADVPSEFDLEALREFGFMCQAISQVSLIVFVLKDLV